jgi:hypothetical protein
VSRYFVSIRGHLDEPLVLVADLAAGRIVRTLPLGIDAAARWAPVTKRGVTGLAVAGDHLFAATWASIHVVHIATGKVEDVITSPLFTDLHGLRVDADGSLWVVSTNLDSVLRVRGHEVVWRWSAFEHAELGEPLSLVERDFRPLQKAAIPYYRHHLNDVHVEANALWISYLGAHRTWVPSYRLMRLLMRLAVPVQRFDGGLLRVDRTTGGVRRVAAINGPHDCLLLDGFLHLTEFLGHRLLRFDRHAETLTAVRLPPRQAAERQHYLARGLCAAPDDGLLVGYTLRRHRRQPGRWARIDRFTRAPLSRTGSLELEGYSDVYTIVADPS